MNKLFLKVLSVVLIAPCMLMLGVFYLNNFEKALTESAFSTLTLHGQMITSFLSEEVLQEVLLEPSEHESGRKSGAGFVSFKSENENDDSRLLKEDLIRQEIFTLSKERAGRIISVLSPFQEVRIRLFDHNALLRADNQQAVPVFQSGVQVEQMGNVLMTGQEIHTRLKEEKELQILMPVKRNNQVAGVLVLQTSDSFIREKMTTMRQILGGLFSMTLLLSLILSFYLSGTIVRPLKALAEGALKTTRHKAFLPDFSARKDDIGRLSQALNHMTFALQSRLEAIESFAGDVAHELKNPLASLRNAVAVFPMIKDKSKQEELFDLIRETVYRMDRLITDISNYSRLDAEILREGAKSVVPFDMLSQMTEKGIFPVTQNQSVEVDFPTSLRKISVTGDESRLAQVFSNVVENALSFSQKDGKVLISARQTGNWLIIDFDDDGKGIQQGEEEKIFTRFYSHRPSDSFGHSGIGLAICRKIIDSMGGKITAGSSHKLKGACFTIVLPISQE